MPAATSDVLIVGAGLTGLVAARQLSSAGLRVVIVEKEKLVGGRLSSESIGTGMADTGAQFFTARSPEFQELVADWLAQGQVYVWSHGWSTGSHATTIPDGFPRYAATGGFQSLANGLLDGLAVHTDFRLVSIDHGSGGWVATDRSGRNFVSRGIIMTPPLPISLSLLRSVKASIPATAWEALSQIRYGPCLCGLFLIAGDVILPEPGALQRPDQPLGWIADNRRKGISPEACVLTVHAGTDISRERWGTKNEQVLSWMHEQVAPYLAGDAQIVRGRVVRWRHALPMSIYPERFLASELLSPLVLAGDAFAGPRVEGAVLSGLAAADAMRRKLVS